MCILPKKLYIFQALPIRIPFSYLKQVQALFIRLFLGLQETTSSRTLLTLPKCYGGLALPDIWRYYQAVQLGRVIDWQRHSDLRLWAQIEQHQSPITLRGALWCWDFVPLDINSHPLIGNTLKQCLHAITHAEQTTKTSPLTLIIGNPEFLPGLPITQNLLF